MMVEYVKEPHLTDGIGAKTAHSILCTSTSAALKNRNPTYAMSAHRKRTNRFAQSEKLSVGNHR